ncbi:MAG: glycosyltransferase [Candidatus Omnitrophica bacterium]|nr:glycosyltransferase [Candidatus Omnitrophota bacterium]
MTVHRCQNTRLRIGYVIWSLGLGGAEQVVLRLASHMKRLGNHVVVFTLNQPGVFASSLATDGIEVISVEKRSRYDFSVLWRLIRQFRKHRLHIVHTHLWGANVWGRVAARLSRVPVVIVHEHGMQSWRSSWHFRLDRWLAPLASRILFVSRKVMNDYLARTGISPARCRFIANGVDCQAPVSDRMTQRRAFGWKEDERIILSIGRLSEEKGYEDLLTAFADVARTQPKVKLVILGEGTQRNDLERLKDSYGLNGQVHMAGLQQNVWPYLAAADLYVQPSRREGLPLAVLEAMASGLPVIATEVGDLKDTIQQGHEGHLVPPQDPKALASSMKEMLQMQPDRRQILVEAAKQKIEKHYSLQQMLKAVEQTYEELLHP